MLGSLREEIAEKDSKLKEKEEEIRSGKQDVGVCVPM